MKNISKNIFLITLLIFVNLAIFLFCKIHTDEGNYIWSKTDPNSKILISIATIDLMRINYYIYANSINIILLGIYFAYYHRIVLGLLVILLGTGVFYGGNKMFENQIAENYYIIFQNQNVPVDFILEPIKSAGKGIGSHLMQDLNNKKSPLRKYAIVGMGEIKYNQASDTLNTILHNLYEDPEIRGEAYLALVKINSEKSSTYTHIFIESVHPVVDQYVIEYINNKTKK